MEKKKVPHESGPAPSHSQNILPLVGVVAVVLVAGFFFMNNSTPPADSTQNVGTITDVPIQATNAALAEQLSKAKYLKEVYKVDRDNYQLYENAAAYRKETLEQTKQFFFTCCSLTGEADVFSQLPPVPSDFAEVAYDLGTGELYQIGLLGPEYYKQPEFYFHGLETAIVNQKAAFSAWMQPQLNYWGDYGLQVMPAIQSDTLSHSGRNTFTSAVFVTNGWNIQNWVGVNLVPNSKALEYFDLSVSEDATGKSYFLLGPTFPRFENEWATKVVIEGTVKPDTPPGTYTISFNPAHPPKELNEKWASEHQGLYVPYGFLVPSEGYITLHITVTE